MSLYFVQLHAMTTGCKWVLNPYDTLTWVEGAFVDAIKPPLAAVPVLTTDEQEVDIDADDSRDASREPSSERDDLEDGAGPSFNERADAV
eukprot:jgi/Chlat1/6704/Chrsp5S00545